MNSFFNSQFSNCPLIWMFHSRIMNNKINRLHERCMPLIYRDKTSLFEELLEQNKSVSIHVGTCKCWPHLCVATSIEVCLSEIFRRLGICYNLRSNSYFAVPNVKSVFHGSKSISYLGPKICDTVPIELKQLTSLNAFKKVLKTGNQKIVLAGCVNSAY